MLVPQPTNCEIIGLVTSFFGISLANLIISEGALILGSGKKSIRFRPHLTISKEEIDLADQIIRRAIARL